MPASWEALPDGVVVEVEEVERLLIHETLRRCGGDKKTAARLLGIAARTIYRKLGDGE